MTPTGSTAPDDLEPVAAPVRSAEAGEFSLLRDGPFYRLMTQARLMRRDLTPEIHRAVALSAIAWLPLLLLSLFGSAAFGSDLALSFLSDVPTAVRFLIAVPMLVIAERVVEGRAAVVARHFILSGLVRKAQYPEFDRILRQVAAMRNSVLAEIVIVMLAIFGVFFLRLDTPAATEGWQFVASAEGHRRTLAGWWDVAVSIPIFQFLLFRWLWRYVIWCWFLWRMSRMDLRLFPTHPDRVAGLGFLSIAQTKFWMVIFAFSSILSAVGGMELFAGRAVFTDFRFLLLGHVVVVMILFLGPLVIFSTKLFEVKTKGVLEYGNLAHEYVWLFHRKWIKREAGESEAIIGSADIQSLADLGNSFEVVRTMRMAPLDYMTTILPLLLATLAPFAPWIAILVPLDKLVKFLLGVV
jgi:hypothetical protein